jgi:hypothetical protein
MRQKPRDVSSPRLPPALRRRGGPLRRANNRSPDVQAEALPWPGYLNDDAANGLRVGWFFVTVMPAIHPKSHLWLWE